VSHICIRKYNRFVLVDNVVHLIVPLRLEVFEELILIESPLNIALLLNF
jgi:hypothetical protein